MGLFDSLDALEILGLTVGALLAAFLFCVLVQLTQLFWFLCIPCRLLFYTVSKCEYKDSDGDPMSDNWDEYEVVICPRHCPCNR